MRIVDIPVDQIYITAGLKKEFDETRVEPLAEDILENGLQKPVYVREGKGRYVLQSGVHRLAAVQLLGSQTIEAHIIQARKA